MPYTHRKVGSKNCVYKKTTGKKVGCTSGSLKKYLAALHINAHEESKTPSKITQKDVIAGVRKSMPPPSKSFKDKSKYSRKEFKSFKAFYKEDYAPGSYAAQNMPGMDGDQTGVEEGEYAQDTGDQIALNDSINKRQIIHDIIGDLKDLRDNHNWNKPVNNDLLKAMADSLKEVDIEPTDFYASIDASSGNQEQFLITGPSSWNGGSGALKDLQAILDNNEPEETEVKEDESDPAPDLPFGTTSMGDPLTQENFIDHKNPEHRGDSKRHGIKKHTSLSSLDKIVHSKTASPRKKQLAHWQANMRRGHKR